MTPLFVASDSSSMKGLLQQNNATIAVIMV